ncbi:TonB C-terminal domain-containing protein [bacterium]|nr:TonB C-terminal domain-containing protein [bacterium]
MDAIIVSLIIHALLLLFIARERDMLISEKSKKMLVFQKEDWDKKKPLMFVYPDNPPSKAQPRKDAPYSDANRVSKNPLKYKIKDRVNSKKSASSKAAMKPKIEEKAKSEEKGDSGSEGTSEEAFEKKDKSSLAYNEAKNRKGPKGPSIQELMENPSKYLKSSELFSDGDGNTSNFGDRVDFLDAETMKHPCWGNYPQRMQMIVRNNIVIPNFLFYSKGKSILWFKLYKSGEISDLRLYKSTGNKQLDNISYHALKSSKFPPYDCDYEFVTVQYTFYLNWDHEEIDENWDN